MCFAWIIVGITPAALLLTQAIPSNSMPAQGACDSRQSKGKIFPSLFIFSIRFRIQKQKTKPCPTPAILHCAPRYPLTLRLSDGSNRQESIFRVIKPHLYTCRPQLLRERSYSRQRCASTQIEREIKSCIPVCNAWNGSFFAS